MKEPPFFDSCMEIYALKGHRVRCISLEAAYEYQEERNREHLQIGRIYTVESTEVSSSTTTVILQEIPEVEFNSTNFEDVEPQSAADSNSHPDYPRWN